MPGYTLGYALGYAPCAQLFTGHTFPSRTLIILHAVTTILHEDAGEHKQTRQSHSVLSGLMSDRRHANAHMLIAGIRNKVSHRRPPLLNERVCVLRMNHLT